MPDKGFLRSSHVVVSVIGGWQFLMLSEGSEITGFQYRLTTLTFTHWKSCIFQTIPPFSYSRLYIMTFQNCLYLRYNRSGLQMQIVQADLFILLPPFLPHEIISPPLFLSVCVHVCVCSEDQWLWKTRGENCELCDRRALSGLPELSHWNSCLHME